MSEPFEPINLWKWESIPKFTLLARFSLFWTGLLLLGKRVFCGRLGFNLVSEAAFEPICNCQLPEMGRGGFPLLTTFSDAEPSEQSQTSFGEIKT